MMSLRPRAIASLTAVGMLLVSCGTAANAPASPAPTATVAPTVAAPTASPVPLPKTLVLIGDTVRGTANLTDDEKKFLTCTQANRFPQGASIVWRYKVLDPVTQKPLTDKQLASFKLVLPDGTSKDFNWGEHPKTSNIWFWTAAFALPMDYPTGAFSYKVVATDLEGRTGSFDQFPVAGSMLQVIPVGTR